MSKGVLGLRGTSVARGILPLLGFAVLTAGMDVYGGNRLQLVSPASLAAISFTLTAAFFLAVEIRRADFRRIGTVLTLHRRDLVAINITTAVTWLATFYALLYLEPAVVNVMALALGPVLTVLAGPLMRRGSTVLVIEVFVSVIICSLLGALVWGSFTGRSGIGEAAGEHVALGIVFSVVCAVGSSANIIYMKRLSDADCDPGTVLATRFFLMIAVAWFLVVLGGDAKLGDAFVPAAIVAVIGVALPIYVLQIGIRHTEPITTSLVVSLSPLFAFVMQFADGRLRPSLLTLGCIVGVVAMVAVGIMARSRQESNTIAEPVVT